MQFHRIKHFRPMIDDNGTFALVADKQPWARHSMTLIARPSPDAGVWELNVCFDVRDDAGAWKEVWRDDLGGTCQEAMLPTYLQAKLRFAEFALTAMATSK